MSKRKTHEQFIEELGKINPSIEILERYIHSHNKIKCKCLIDGYIWNPVAYSLLKTHGCPKCAGKVKAKKEEKHMKNL